MERNALSYYLDLLAQIDEYSSKLQSAYPRDVTCHPGCSDCCVADLTVFPVEAESIRLGVRQLAKHEREHLAEHVTAYMDRGGDRYCALLTEHLCAIYDWRPILCRTHGLPVRFIPEEHQPAEYDVCPLNFDATRRLTILQESQFLDLDHLNFLLVTINYKFMKERAIRPDCLREPILDLIVEELGITR